MCAGAAAAKTANKNAIRQYKYNLEVRKRKHMQKLSIYNAKKIQYAQASQNIHTGMTEAFDRAQIKLGKLKQSVATENQKALIKMFQNSKYGNLMASGAAGGRSLARIGVMENAALGRYYASNMRQLTDATDQFRLGTKSTRRRAALAREKEFTNVAFQPVTDVAPPKPALQNVGLAMFSDVMGFASSVASIASSERALKENIKQIGTAKSGLGIYKFSYKEIPHRTFVGTMADEVAKIFPEAIVEMPDNRLGVAYDLIDVEMREVV